ncbi:MAG TPA: hypothetical protein VFW87_23200, partial [Pirellulales bacterium]|nr:hypothetical protein [Pirellulales bacterium]
MSSVLLYFCIALSADIALPQPTVVVVVGASGTEEFGKQFRQWAERWQAAADRAGASFDCIGLDEDAGEDRQRLRQRLTDAAPASDEPLWLVLIGHGTFDGQTARFNLRGPDVSAAELAAWLEQIERPLAMVNCASASGPFINALSGKNRVVVTAAKSGFEHNFARFGDYLSAAIGDPAADLDKDEQTSLLEAFLMASAKTQEFYAEDARLATEHALIDDNGDALGTPADWFQGVRATRSAKEGAAVDGLRASQMQLVRSQRERQLPADARTRRDELERQIAALRERKAELGEEAYYRDLEKLLVELAGVYEPKSPFAP